MIQKTIMTEYARHLTYQHDSAAFSPILYYWYSIEDPIIIRILTVGRECTQYNLISGF